MHLTSDGGDYRVPVGSLGHGQSGKPSFTQIEMVL